MAELNSFPQRSGARHALKRIPARVDLTAMVDLAFLLITFFMLTTILVKPKAMRLNMPADMPSEPVPETGTMTICLGKSNQVIWYLGMAAKPLIGPVQAGNGKELIQAILETRNRIFKTSGKTMGVIVKPSDHSDYENLVETLDDLNITQAPGYAIAKISANDIDFLKQHRIY
jgi:biopolymer transport protein ExbD